MLEVESASLEGEEPLYSSERELSAVPGGVLLRPLHRKMDTRTVNADRHPKQPRSPLMATAIRT